MMRRTPTFRLRRGAVAAGLCLALAACENPFSEDAPSLDEVLSGGWLFGDKAKADRPPMFLTPVYCYETIGDGDCYEQPLEGGGNRLIGFTGPPPPPSPPRPAQ